MNTSVLEQHLLAPIRPLHLQLLEAPHWEHHCLGHREEAGRINPVLLEGKGHRGKA